MKIKQVCELTGLTDKTVRFYIDNDLIAPHCTENYLGRRSFAFSEENLRELENIATLRKSGFSVAQIKAIQNEKEKSKEIIPQLMQFKENQIKENKLINAALRRLEKDKAYSVSEIAEVLREPVKEVEVRQDEDNVWYILYKWGKRVMIALWLLCSSVAIGTAIKSVISSVNYYSPLFTVLSLKRTLLVWGVIFSPIVVFLISLTIKKHRKIKNFSLEHNLIVVVFLLITFILRIPLFMGALGVFHEMDYGAKTKLPENYFVITHPTEPNDLLYSVFPDKVPVNVMTKYYLCNHKKECNCEKPVYFYTNYLDWDVDVYEMYAEWILDETAFAAEKERIYAVGGTEHAYGDYTVKSFKWETDWKGTSCLAFAYNEKMRKVRYICYSGYHPEGKKPFCESVEWINA